MKKSAILLLALAALAVLIFFTTKPAAPPAVALPQPNGYDDFKRAAQVVVHVDYYSVRAQGVAQLRVLVTQNAEALALVRTGLTKQCLVPLEYSRTYITNRLRYLAEFKTLALALRAEGKLAEREGRTNDAVRSYLDCIRFGAESARGGLMIEKLVGVACQAIGMAELRKVSGALDARESQAVLEALAKVNREHEPAESILQREKIWSRYAHSGWQSMMARFQSLWYRLITSSTASAEQKFLFRCHRIEAEIRLLRVDLALKLYRLENATYPRKLQELTPKYLEAVPLDPFNSNPLVYRPQTNGYLLYSVGPDGKDDGGTPLTRSSGDKGDLVSTPLLIGE